MRGSESTDAASPSRDAGARDVGGEGEIDQAGGGGMDASGSREDAGQGGGSDAGSVDADRPDLGPTFSTMLNPTGDPIGGGPGYTGAWRQAQGLAGEAICEQERADHVVDTEGQLRRLALSYYDRELSREVNGAAPARAGEVVFVRGGPERDLRVDQTLMLDFAAGVTVCSDLGAGVLEKGGTRGGRRCAWTDRSWA